ncbi:alpha-1,2-fucosyltransferase [Candidatus Methylopumilus universalis]|uniref:alpha-1,2-fucosyltransferase n=1 Tax=Candidatus Methylopumilus universalis TaxID=2588536 RepID=UPI003BEEBA13
MIFVHLRGGLGNQMFQFAAGYALARKVNGEVSIILTSAMGDTQRKYELNNFIDINSHYTCRRQLAFEMFFRFISLLKIKKSFYEKNAFIYDPAFFDIGRNVNIFGYFQSEKYFKFIRKDILNIFKFKGASDPNYLEVVRKIQASNSVSVHIRRGDYVLNKTANAFHGVLSIAYYKKALNHIKANVAKPKIFLFSDDPEWVRKNFSFIGRFDLVDFNRGELSYRDMELMSLCKHNIIANSSFSWWGAWLNLNKDKIVIAPKKWLRDESVPLNDIIPESWVSL